jgi:hypothetical protein
MDPPERLTIYQYQTLYAAVTVDAYLLLMLTC